MSARYGEKAYPVQGRAEPEFGPEPSDADLSLILRFDLSVWKAGAVRAAGRWHVVPCTLVAGPSRP
jgi:hypothetical protein